MLRRFPSRLLSLLLAVSICAALLCPVTATAASKTFRLLEGSIVIGADGDGHYVKVGEKRTTLSADTEIVIEGDGAVTSNTIRVLDHVTASITLSGVRIESTDFLCAPFELCGAERVTLTLKGANALTAPQYMSALQVGRYATLEITGDGSLSARGGMSAAAIGGGWKSGVSGAPGGNVKIGGSVRISAYGGDFGAAIGGGEGGSSGTIEIAGHASVYALGGKHAAAIGSGSGGRSKNISISDHAVVEAAGGDSGAGIGSGRGGSASKITLSGNCSVRAAGGSGAAAIGGGHKASASTARIIDEASVRTRGGSGAAAIGAGEEASLSIGVTIDDFATVFAIGGDGGAGIGGSNLSAGILTVSGSSLVEAYGGKYGAGIGSGQGGKVEKISVGDRASLYAYGGLHAAGIGTGESGTYGEIRLFGSASVLTLGGKYGAGIGGGKTAECGTLHIYDSVSVTAQGGNFGAGIGTGAKNAPDYAPTAGSIYIYGNAAVRAAGGTLAAGVGGGLYASGGKVLVSDTASVDAYDNLTVEPENASPEAKADYSIVEAALAKVPENLTDYTEQSVTLLENTIKQIVYDLPSAQQAQVDTYAAAIERAISVLVKKTVTRTLTPSAESYPSGEPITIAFKGATSPKDRILVLKKGHLPSDTAIDPDFNVPYGTALLSAYCAAADGSLLEEGSVILLVSETNFLYNLGLTGLPAGEYTAYFYLENSDTPAALANFTVTAAIPTEADYTPVETAIAAMPSDSSLYTPQSWAALQRALDQIVYNQPADMQATVDGYATAIRDAISALVPITPAANATAAFRLPAGSDALSATRLIHVEEAQNRQEELLLLAQSSGAPEKFGWGLIPMQSTNLETTGPDSVVSAINYVPANEDILVDSDESFDTKDLAASKVGAGAGCTMSGSFTIAQTALLNGLVAANTITLEYGASIGTLTFDYISTDSFTLPASPICPGYVFKGWSTDENGSSPISGTFTVSSDMTFYANWEVVPVSIEKEFRFSSATLGSTYSDTLKLSEASANFTVSVSTGELPKGLSLDPATGTISGVATDLGTYDFTLLIIDANGTRTEEAYSITVYQSVEMNFTFYTSENDHSATEGEILFSYTYRDRGNGTVRESEPVNLSEFFSSSDGALTPGSEDTLTLTVGAFVGEPLQLFFRNTSDEDGYRIDKVLISSAGGDGMDAFEKTYQINTWIGHIDDANFFESGTFVVFLILFILLLILLGIFFFLRFKNRKGGPKGPCAPKKPNPAPGVPTQADAGTPHSPVERIAPATSMPPARTPRRTAKRTPDEKRPAPVRPDPNRHP